MKTNNPHVGTGCRHRRGMQTTNNQEELKRFSKNLRDAFVKTDYPSIAKLADAAGVDRTAVRMAMAGNQFMNIITLTKVCKALNVSLDEVMKGVVEY